MAARLMYTGLPQGEFVDERLVPFVPLRLGLGVGEAALLVVVVDGGGFPAGVPAW